MKYLLTLLTLFIFTGCIPKQETVENFFQTDSATSIKKDYAYIIKSLKTFKNKINREVLSDSYLEVLLESTGSLESKNKDIILKINLKDFIINK